MKRILSIILLVCIFATIPSAAYADSYQKIEKTNVSVYVGNSWHTVKAFLASYDNNYYLSMRSVAEAFADSSIAFDFSYEYTQADGSFFTITTGTSYVVRENKDSDEVGFISLYRNRLFVDGQERKYYSFLFGNPADLYFCPSDLCAILNISASYIDNGAFCFYENSTYKPDLQLLARDGYFDSLHACYFANKADGQTYYSLASEEPFAIASLTKLMSYLIIMEKVDRGDIHLDDIVTTTENVHRLSDSENGLIPMETGNSPTVNELINAMLVASSNEASLALAEYTYGHESSFVTQMNRKARSLGLTSALFYNCNGLPVYSEGLFPVKRQNMMSAEDLFTLTSYLLDKYPQITDISSQLFAYFPTFDYNTANTNTILFNIPSITGLKTGNTNLAGSCLVACDKYGNIAVILGAEDNSQRDRTAEILFRSIG